MIRVRSKADPYQTRRMLFVTAWQGVEVRGAYTVLHKLYVPDCGRVWLTETHRPVEKKAKDGGFETIPDTVPHRAMYGPVCLQLGDRNSNSRNRLGNAQLSHSHPVSDIRVPTRCGCHARRLLVAEPQGENRPMTQLGG